MKRLSLLMAMLLLAGLWLPDAMIAVPVSAASPINPALQAALSNQPAGQPVSVIVVLKNQENVRAIRGKNRADRKRRVVQALRKRAEADQKGLRALLRQLQSAGTVQSFTPLWVMNAVAVTGDSAAINQLAQLPVVGSIVADAIIQAPSRTFQTSASSTPAANLGAINAPALWSLGYYGQGIVVANMDTGVDNTHPDLAAQWRGGTNSWYDPYGQHPTTPTDLNGHGTWTMGVMVGGSASGTAIGVAPQAQWIAVKIFNDSGVATSSAIHMGFQWLLDPDGDPNTADAPDVVNNSWALSNAGGCDLSFEPDLQSLVAAGITPVFAAGNYGPNASTSVSPSNNPDALAVGAINNTGVVYYGSSRGPTSCGGSARTYPDLAAPGVNINSTDLYGFYYGATGTSLAAPHVAGTLTLLLSANPNLTVADQRSALLNSAVDLGTAGADNTFGAGRIDALAAYISLAAAQPTATTQPDGQPTDTPTATAIVTSTATSIPTPTSTPTNTPLPTSTPTNAPTNTPLPTSTPTNTAIPTVAPPADLIFADGFETGTLAGWTASMIDAGDLSVNAAAALIGTNGLKALIDDNNTIYVTDDTPNAEPRYRSRFYFDPNSIAMANTNAHYIFYGYSGASTVVLRLELRFASNTYQLRAALLNNSTGWMTSNWFSISDAPHSVEIDWRAATAVGANDGGLMLWVDGAQKANLTGVANDTRRIDRIRLGAIAGIDNGTRGTYYFDAFESRRTSYIGPVTGGPTPTPTSTPLPATSTPTNTATSVPPTSTPTKTPTAVPSTSTAVPPTSTPTNTTIPPTPAAVPPTSTPTKTPTAILSTSTAVPPTNTPTPTAIQLTSTPTPTATPTAAAGFPATGVLDPFTRVNGVLGSNWSGATAGYSIASNQVDVTNGGNIFWKASSFGADQEAYITLTTIDQAAGEIDLLLKAQNSSTYTGGVIEVLYNPAAHHVQVWTYAGAQGWVQRGADIPVTFINGDRFGARATTNGQLKVYQNGTLLASRDVSSWTYAASGGYIGLWFDQASNALFDDFGGG